jgi:hypothetical protein
MKGLSSLRLSNTAAWLKAQMPEHEREIDVCVEYMNSRRFIFDCELAKLTEVGLPEEGCNFLRQCYDEDQQTGITGNEHKVLCSIAARMDREVSINRETTPVESFTEFNRVPVEIKQHLKKIVVDGAEGLQMLAVINRCLAFSSPGMRDLYRGILRENHNAKSRDQDIKNIADLMNMMDMGS